jgi:SnoaL-like domain
MTEDMRCIPLADVQEATRPVLLYGHLVDARDWAGLAEIFTASATIEWVNDEASTTLAIGEVLLRLAAYDHPSAHHATNVLTEVIDQDTIQVTSKGLAVESDGRTWSVTYHDIVVRTADGWRIKQRVVRERPSRAREERTRATR